MAGSAIERISSTSDFLISTVLISLDGFHVRSLNAVVCLFMFRSKAYHVILIHFLKSTKYGRVNRSTA